MSKKVFCTIIIPVYNTESMLRECLDSVVNQTNSDFDVVIVNDGSTDDSQSIIDEYVQTYQFINFVS